MELVWSRVNDAVLVNGNGSFEDYKTSICAKTFEIMMELADNVIERYKSDLWHDAIWLNDALTGPDTFEWIIRESGTWIGETAEIIQPRDWAGGRKYKFELVFNDKWVLNIYEASICTGHEIEGSLQHDGDTCPEHEDTSLKEEFLTEIVKEPASYREAAELGEEALRNYVVGDSDGTFTEDDQGNWHPVPDPMLEIMGLLFEPNKFPTSRNNETVEQTAPRKENRMLDDLIHELREKIDELNNAKDEAEDGRDQLQEFIDNAESAVDEYEGLIDALERLSVPEISVNVSVDVYFES